MPKVSVIIVSYNVRGFLENLLASLRRALEGITSEIIIVDNSSDDDTIDFVRRDFPEVNLIENRTNVGFGKANNQAVKAATGEYLLLINPDSIVEESTVKEMLAFYSQYPDAGAAGCKILNADGTLQKACRRSFPTPWVALTKILGLSALFPKSKLFGRYNLTYLNPEEVHEVDAISGSFMFIPRKNFQEAGGFDEDYFMYGEDIDLCFRIKQAGYKVYYNPKTSVIHFKGESTRRSNINRTFEFYRAMSIFVGKRYGANSFLSRLLRLAILLNRQSQAFFALLKNISPVIVDFAVSVAAMFIGEFLRTHKIYAIPSYGRPYFYMAPGLVLVLFGIGLGIYGENKFSFRLSFLTTLLTFLLFSSLTYFFKQFAFSRFIVLIASLIMILVIPGWRLIYQLKNSVGTPRHPVFGRRTIVVGMDEKAVELIKKIRGKISMGYDIVGIISEDAPGETRVLGIKVLGTLADLPKVVRERKIDDVVFASGKISYSQVLQAVASVKSPAVNFKLVPDTMDVIIGKTYVDGLADVPFVDIDYNINRTRSRVVKRFFDVLFALIGMIVLSPVVLLRKDSAVRRVFRKLPDVLDGKWSAVGRSEYYPQGSDEIFGKMGITGVVQLNRGQSLSPEEVDKLYIYYARNQSIWLDIEIIAKSFLQLIKRPLSLS
ncbi:MAG: glycosyltransferase [Bacteroidetes bacterium]|nr:glycosyltransferase [Bacteroidota bacterium]MCL5738959.1 glycosyltransferase [Bacteroidota bacterium]